MGSPSDASHVVPTHQRITSSKQWVLDHRREPTARHTSQVTTPAAPPVDKETKKRLKELETAKLQMEYDSVKQENDKLKKVIVRLKQEIQTYNGLLASEPPVATSVATAQPLQNPPVSDLLINRGKRRKKSLEPGVATATGETTVSHDDILLMNTLTDVLAQMEQP